MVVVRTMEAANEDGSNFDFFFIINIQEPSQPKIKPLIVEYIGIGFILSLTCCPHSFKDLE